MLDFMRKRNKHEERESVSGRKKENREERSIILKAARSRGRAGIFYTLLGMPRREKRRKSNVAAGDRATVKYWSRRNFSASLIKPCLSKLANFPADYPLSLKHDISLITTINYHVISVQSR